MLASCLPSMRSTRFSFAPLLCHWGLVCCAFLVCLSNAGVTFAACGERLAEVERSVGLLVLGLRTAQGTVREAESKTQGQEAIYQNLRLHPPEDYDQALARQIGKIRRTIVRPQRSLLAQLKEQHATTRRQWEQGLRLAHEQFREAEAAYRKQMLTEEVYCQAREVYVEALTRYRGGLEQYRTGLSLYTDALNAYREQFVVPCIRGYTNPAFWQALITRFEKDDFLQELLNSLTANAIRRLPPELPSNAAQPVSKRP